jgi:predicted component of type VI protein secretion system
MDKKDLSERDICTKYINHAVKLAGWDEMTQLREEVSFTKGRIIVRGKLVTRGSIPSAQQNDPPTSDSSVPAPLQAEERPEPGGVPRTRNAQQANPPRQNPIPIEKTSSFPLATSRRDSRRNSSASSRSMDWVRTLIANAEVSSVTVKRETRPTLSAALTIRSTAAVPASGW